MSPVTHALFYGMTIRPETGLPQPVANKSQSVWISGKEAADILVYELGIPVEE